MFQRMKELAITFIIIYTNDNRYRFLFFVKNH